MSPTRKPSLPVDVYIRVSRVMGREGESYISPQVQEERCRAQLAADGYEVGQVFTDEDQSGSTQDRPAYNRAMERVRDGLSGGIVVAKLNRLGRTTRGVLEDIAEIESYGAVVLAVDEKLDTSTSIGRFVLRMFASIAELELDRIRDGWKDAHTKMIERGVQSGRPPLGYAKSDDGRLVVNGTTADLMREVFRFRADGANWGEVARFLNEREAPNRSGKPWTAQSAKKLLGNRAYLGVARHGEMEHEGAHEALVDERIFRLANRKAERVAGERSDGHILGAGLVRCGVCGSAMVKSHTTGGKGERYEFLRCSSNLKGHPTISLKTIRPYLIAKALEGWSQEPVEFIETAADPEIEQRYQDIVSDLAELDALLEAGTISASAYAVARSKAETDRDALQVEIDAAGVETALGLSRRDVAETQGVIALFIETLSEEDAGKLIETYGLAGVVAQDIGKASVPQARRFLKERLGKVTVAPGRAPVAERVTIG